MIQNAEATDFFELVRLLCPDANRPIACVATDTSIPSMEDWKIYEYFADATAHGKRLHNSSAAAV